MDYSLGDVVAGSIGPEDLAQAVRRAVGKETARVINWQRDVLQGGAGYIGSVHRFAGAAEADGTPISWSLILKAVRADASEPPSAFGYWQREPLAYESGVLDELPGGSFAPRCYGSIITEDGALLWLEDVRDDLGGVWPLEHYGVVARHLGQLNGTFLGDADRLGLPWLSTDWLAAWVEQVAPFMDGFTSTIEHPVFARIYSPEVAECVLRLWTDRARLLRTLAELPQTFCHLDAFRRNVMARGTVEGDPQTVLLDWAFVGRAALGEELAPLVAASVLFDATADWECLPDLDQAAFSAYVDGLHDAGWRGDPDEVRFAYATASALRYLVGSTRFLLGEIDDRGRADVGEGWANPQNQSTAEAIFGRPFPNLVEHFAGTFTWLAGLGKEALRHPPT